MRTDAQDIASRANWNILRLRSAVRLVEYLGHDALAYDLSRLEHEIIEARDHDLRVLKEKEEKNG